jgi:hypothetical protein
LKATGTLTESAVASYGDLWPGKKIPKLKECAVDCHSISSKYNLGPSMLNTEGVLVACSKTLARFGFG